MQTFGFILWTVAVFLAGMWCIGPAHRKIVIAQKREFDRREASIAQREIQMNEVVGRLETITETLRQKLQQQQLQEPAGYPRAAKIKRTDGSIVDVEVDLKYSDGWFHAEPLEPITLNNGDELTIVLDKDKAVTIK